VSDDFFCVRQHSHRRRVVAAEHAFDDLLKKFAVRERQLPAGIRNGREEERHTRQPASRLRKHLETSRDPLWLR